MELMFFLLNICSDKLKIENLLYYVYLSKYIGINLNFSYRIESNGLASYGVDELLDSMLSSEKFVIINDYIELTDIGKESFNKLMETADQWEKITNFKNLLKNCNSEDLYFICIVDLVVFDYYKNFDYKKLQNEKENICNLLQRLYSGYSYTKFENTLKIIRLLK